MPMAPPPPGAGGTADGPQAWYMSLPIITRCWFTACCASTVLSAAGMVSPMTLMLDWSSILWRFQIWRVFTCFTFLGKFGWPFVMNLIFVVQYAKTLEGDFSGVAADFLWCLMLGGSALCFINHASGMELPFLTIPLIFMCIWIWSRKHPNAQMSVFGLFNIASAHFPWFLICLSMLMGGSPVQNLMGYFVGHLYWFLKEVHPATAGHRFFRAPSLLRTWIEDEPLATTAGHGGAVRRGGQGNAFGLGGAAAGAAANARVAPDRGGAFAAFRGQGNRLGGD